MVAVTALDSTETDFISEPSLAAALDGLCYISRAQMPTSLERLLIVDEALISLDLPHTRLTRRYALAHVLTAMISDGLFELRRIMGIADFEAETSREAALAAIAADGRTANPELLGWSWLYYHYVRVELDIPVSLFCRAACIHVRTLPRYKQRTLRRLTFQVIRQEAAARQQYRKHRMAAQLPVMKSPTLYGRDELLKKSVDLSTALSMSPIQIVGAPGIGKTVFVQKAIQSLIERDAIDSLIWLSSPTSAYDIHQRLATFLQAQNPCSSIRDLGYYQRTAVVLDAVDDLAHDAAGLEAILNDFSLTLVYLTSRTILPFRNTMRYIVLSELEEADAKRLIRVLLDQWHIQGQEPLASDDLQTLWEQAGGNPRLLEHAVLEYQRQVCSAGLTRVTSSRSPHLLTRSYQRATCAGTVLSSGVIEE